MITEAMLQEWVQNYNAVPANADLRLGQFLVQQLGLLGNLHLVDQGELYETRSQPRAMELFRERYVILSNEEISAIADKFYERFKHTPECHNASEQVDKLISRIRKIEFHQVHTCVFCYIVLDNGHIIDGKSGAVSQWAWDYRIGKTLAWRRANEKLVEIASFQAQDELLKAGGVDILMPPRNFV